MKLLLLSDSHGLETELVEIIEREKNNVDAIIHCGDSELPYEKIVKLTDNLEVVGGNCDYDENFPDEIVKEFSFGKVLLTHGHNYNIKMSKVNISYRAQEVGARLVCFGHTHFAEVFQENEIIFINPGSIRLPRGRKEKSYAIVHFQEEKKLATVIFYETDSRNEILDLSKSFSIV